MGVGSDQKEKLKNKDNIQKIIQDITIQKEKANKIDDNNNSLETNTDNNDKKIEDDVDKQDKDNEEVNKVNNKENNQKEIVNENIDNNIVKEDKDKINDIIKENNKVNDITINGINSNENNNEEALLIFKNRIKNKNINADTYKRLMKNKTDISLKTSNSKRSIRKTVIDAKNKLGLKPENSFLSLYSFYHTKDLLSEYENLKLSKKKSKINMFNCLNRTNSINSIYDKERIKMELSKVKKEIESINVDILNCKKLKEKFENRFNANKKIIEKILNIDVKDIDNSNDNDIGIKDITKNNNKNNLEKSEGNISDNTNIYLTALNIGKYKNDEGQFEKEIIINNQNENLNKNENEENKDNENENDQNKSFDVIKKLNSASRAHSKIKKKRRRYRMKSVNSLILGLKKETSYFDSSIESKNKLIEEKKNDGRVNSFLKLNKKIYDKNKDLEQLEIKMNSLHNNLLEIEKKIEITLIKAQKAFNEQKRLNKVIDCNKSTKEKKEKEIELFLIEKDNLNKKIKILEDEHKSIIKKNQEKKDYKKKLENDIKFDEEIFIEKNKEEKEINNLDNKKNIIKKDIVKNEIIIQKLKKKITSSLEVIDNYLTYMKKTKLINKNKEKKENIENETKKCKNENGFEHVKHIKINQEIINNKLRKKIIELLEEFKNKSEKNKKLKEELDVIKMEYQKTIVNKN